MKNIICFANDWSADPLSKKHVMVRMARHRKVLWINSINNRAPRLEKKDFQRIFDKLKQFRSGLKNVHLNIWVLAPIFIPFHGNPLVRWLNNKLLGFQIRRAARKLQLGSYVSWVYVPTASNVVGDLGEDGIVYHCVDEYSAFSDAASTIAVREADLLHKSDFVVTSASRLQETKQAVNPNCHLITHGVDYEHFSKVPDLEPAAELGALPRPVLGFHGLIADWVNLPLIADLARMHPEWSVVIVGKVDTDVSIFKDLKNVHLIGHRKYEQLPNYLRGFDIAILPFVVNELTIAANPLKLREYLAAGLPVIAAPLPEIKIMGDLVRLGDSAAEYEAHVQQLIAAKELGPQRERSERMKTESWDFKVAEMEALLERYLSDQKPELRMDAVKSTTV